MWLWSHSTTEELVDEQHDCMRRSEVCSFCILGLDIYIMLLPWSAWLVSVTMQCKARAAQQAGNTSALLSDS